MGGHNAAGDGQPQSRPARGPTARRLAAIELLEAMRQIGRAEAGASVGDNEDDAFRRNVRADSDPAAGRRVAQGVTDQVAQHALDLARLGGHGGQAGRDFTR